MSRELQTTLLIMLAVLVLGAPIIFADAPQTQGTTSYLALVFQLQPSPTPTPVPTPVPPPIESLVIQLSEMKSGYVRDEGRMVTNADAAKEYHDPKAATAAFAQQGRETSWLAIYSSTDYLFSDALAVGNQVYRYLTIDGASAGFAYTIAEEVRDNPDFRPFNVSAPCCPIVGLRRIGKQGTLTYDDYYIIMQNGRYVAHAEVIGVVGSVDVSRAIAYAQLALNHITTVPQALQADDGPAPASAPQPGTIDAALKPQ
jgi:hypothetical protein